MLAPDLTTAQNQMTNNLNAGAAMTAWVQALEDCVLPPLTPMPTWYTSINSNLQSAQSSSMSWLTTTAPAVFASSTEAYIAYANLFNATLTPLTSLMAAIATQSSVPTSAQQEELVELVTNLLGTAQTNLTTAQTQQSQVAALQSTMQTEQSTLASAINSALVDEAADGAQIAAVQASIQALMLTLTADNTNATSSSVSAGSSVASFLFSLTFGLAISGGVLAIGTIAGAVLSIGVAVTEQIIYTEAAQQIVANITALMATLAQDEVQLITVQGALNGLQSLSGITQQTLETFADLTALWSSVVDDLQWLLVVLAQPQLNVTTIPALNTLNTANAAWQSILQFAQDAQNVPLLPATTTTALPTASIQ